MCNAKKARLWVLILVTNFFIGVLTGWKIASIVAVMFNAIYVLMLVYKQIKDIKFPKK